MILSSKGHVEIEGDTALICAEMDCLLAAFRNELKERLGKDKAEASFEKIVKNSKNTSELISKSSKMVKIILGFSEEGE